MKKDDITIIIFNLLETLLLFLLIRWYTNEFIISYFIFLIITFILILLFSKKRYISKFTITFHTLYTLISSISIISLIALKVFELPDGWQGLGASVIMMFYFLFQSTFIGVLLIVNLIKYLIFKKGNKQ